MVAVEHSNKNLQVLSCLAPGNQQDAVGPGSRLVCSDFPWLPVAVVSVGGCS